jgi:hypothetical protein
MEEKFNFNIVGIQYRDVNLDEVRTLLQNFPLILVYEPDNKYDSNAIKCTLNDVHIGYVERSKCKIIKNIFIKEYFINYKIEVTNFTPISTLAEITFEYDQNIFDREQELAKTRLELRKQIESRWITHPDYINLKKQLEDIEITITKLPASISITSSGWFIFFIFPFHIYSIISIYRLIFSSSFRNDPDTLAYSIPIICVAFFCVILMIQNDKKKKEFDDLKSKKETKRTEILKLMQIKKQKYFNDQETQLD